MTHQIYIEAIKAFWGGCYLLYLFLQTKFRPHLGLAVVLFLWSLLWVIFPDSYTIRIAIIAIPLLTVLFYGIFAIEKWAQEGKRYAPDDKDLKVAFGFVIIYAVIKLLLT